MLLFDQNLSAKLCTSLADVFPGSVHVLGLGLERATDRQIWEYAKSEGLVIVTQDADFFDLAALYGSPPQVIWLRSGNQPTAAIERKLRNECAIIALREGSQVSCIEIF